MIHWFNHCLELAIKDAFKNDNFNKIDEMLMKFHYLYQESPKRQCQSLLKVIALTGLTIR